MHYRRKPHLRTAPDTKEPAAMAVIVYAGAAKSP